jgi:hypothetical protein
MKDNEQVAEEQAGEVYESLSRSNSQIRKDRGDAIAEDLETVFKRAAEDSARDLNRLIRNRKAMYDFSPSQTTSLVLAKDVIADEILEQDKTLTLEIRNKKIEHELDVERYETLFGKKFIQ